MSCSVHHAATQWGHEREVEKLVLVNNTHFDKCGNKGQMCTNIPTNCDMPLSCRLICRRPGSCSAPLSWPLHLCLATQSELCTSPSYICLWCTHLMWETRSLLTRSAPRWESMLSLLPSLLSCHTCPAACYAPARALACNSH